tara:strand:+ start:17602 stop:18210 length:609 start_codon:yes stop_codon:yes gene_type:complete
MNKESRARRLRLLSLSSLHKSASLADDIETIKGLTTTFDFDKCKHLDIFAYSDKYDADADSIYCHFYNKAKSKASAEEERSSLKNTGGTFYPNQPHTSPKADKVDLVGDVIDRLSDVFIYMFNNPECDSSQEFKHWRKRPNEDWHFKMDSGLEYQRWAGAMSRRMSEFFNQHLGSPPSEIKVSNDDQETTREALGPPQCGIV